MNVKPVETKYGKIHSRDAVSVIQFFLTPAPFEIKIIATLWLPGCIPKQKDRKLVNIIFDFRKIDMISIYTLDKYPYEKHSISSFDEVIGENYGCKKRYILSTYDHVFDIVGDCELLFPR